MSDSRRQSVRDPRDVIIESAWPKWAVLIESQRRKGRDLTLSELRGLFPVPSPSREALWERHQRTTKHLPPFRTCVSLRQLRRLAESHRIPGCYRLKRGHYRIRPCRALFRWIAGGGAAPRPTRMWRRSVEEEKSVIGVIALQTKSGLNGAFEKNPNDLWNIPVAKLPAQVRSASASARAERIEIALAMSELLLASKRLTAREVARRLGISRATLYRREFRELRKVLDNDFTLSRDPRAKRLWAGKLAN